MSNRTLDADQILSRRTLGRRSIALLGAAATATVGALGIVTATGCCLTPGGIGGPTSGCSDTDPSDPAGNGRHCAPGARGCSDTDPSDPAGQGRHC